jgi:hypothetical protein
MTDHAQLQTLAKRHLLMHFTRQSAYETDEVPVISHGEHCSVYDTNGKKYFDALSGLFCTQIGYSFGAELGEAAAKQMAELPFYTNWNYAHPRSVELAGKVAELAPGDLNRIFFVSGGSEANESIIKLVKQFHQFKGFRNRYKMIARRIAYHGTTYGALSLTGVAPLRTPFEPLMPGVRHVSNTNSYRRPQGETEAEFTQFLLDELRAQIEQETPETVAAVFIEPVQNSGGTFTPPEGYCRGVREICDEYGILLVADEVICGFGRLGEWFGCERYGYEPDLITCAKGLTSGYASLGAVLISDRVAEPFVERGEYYLHGITFGGHPMATAIGLANLDVMERLDVLGNVRANEAYFAEQLHGLAGDHDIVGDVRGAGYFMSLELVKDRATRETFSPEECQVLLREFLSPELQQAGVICRADDRGDPVIQISPPLVAGQAEFDKIVGILGEVLTEAWERI